MISIDKEIKKIKKALSFSSDLVERLLEVDGKKVCLLYLDGMINVKTIDLGVVDPIL